MRTVAVVTTSRADYGIYKPLLQAIEACPDLKLHLIVSGTHLSPEFGLTERTIIEDRFVVSDRVEMLLSSDSPEGISKSVGLGVLGFSQLWGRFRPDIIVVLGDRYEMFAVALSALPFKIPVAHLHGGEVTEGAIDDSLRHAMTKLSHLHFVSTQEYKDRVIQLGEEPWRVIVSGACGLDNLKEVDLVEYVEFANNYNIQITPPFLLVTFHPVSLEFEQTQTQVNALLDALEQVDYSVLFTMANADTSGHLVNRLISDYVLRHPDKTQIVKTLGLNGYFNAMNLASAMVGNSSSGIIEAASFELPVVNIGNRQHGRIRGENVIDVGYSSAEIVSGIRTATSVEFNQTILDLVNPYGDGHAAERIVAVLRNVPLDAKLIKKTFYDLK